MFSLLALLFFFMAAIPPSGRSSKRKLSAEDPTLLEQHLPKNAQALLSRISEDDRETLNYMLAFGLHMQVPSSRLQWKQWKSSSMKVGLKGGHAFHHHSVPAAMQQKASRLCACDCFSCYASFWSRWADSPNRDLLNMIIEIDEMADERGVQKASKGKEKKKKQEKKHMEEHEAGGKKGKGGKWKLQSAPQTSATLINMLEAGSCPPKDMLPCRTDVDALCKVSNMKNRSSRDEPSSWAPLNQTRAPAIVQEELDGGPFTQGSSPGPLCFVSRQSKNNVTIQRTGKRKSNQIRPLVLEGSFVLAEEEEQDSSASTGKADDLRVTDANLRGKGVLSRIFPDAVCGVAARLWDLVSTGSRNRTME